MAGVSASSGGVVVDGGGSVGGDGSVTDGNTGSDGGRHGPRVRHGLGDHGGVGGRGLGVLGEGHSRRTHSERGHGDADRCGHRGPSPPRAHPHPCRCPSRSQNRTHRCLRSQGSTLHQPRRFILAAAMTDRRHIRVPVLGKAVTPIGSDFVSLEAASGIVLLLAAVGAIVWANADTAGYVGWWGRELTIGVR